MNTYKTIKNTQCVTSKQINNVVVNVMKMHAAKTKGELLLNNFSCYRCVGYPFRYKLH